METECCCFLSSRGTVDQKYTATNIVLFPTNHNADNLYVSNSCCFWNRDFVSDLLLQFKSEA